MFGTKLTRRLTLIVLSLLGITAHAKYTVCTVTINSSDERETFKKRLNPADFDFVELTDYNDKDKGEDSFFNNACQAGVKCDVLAVSGHFGGNFFGATKLSLKLKTLEKASCQRRCTGVLDNLIETYLFGCNTLADKNKDNRTPEQYLDVLVRDGIDRADAERIVASRYGPFGSSYRDRMERIFEGTPAIYGFSSVGPSGANVKATLNMYLTKIGDFKTHLDDVKAGRVTSPWMDVMKAYNRAIGKGLTKSNPAYVIKENSCALEDPDRPLGERIGMAAHLLDSNSMLYMPIVSSFAKEDLKWGTNGSTDGQSALIQMGQRQDLARLFEKTSRDKGVLPSIQLDLVAAAKNFGWITKAQQEDRIRQTFATFTAKLDNAGADFLCSQIEDDSDNAKFLSDADLLRLNYDQAFELKLAGCSRSKNSLVTKRVLDGINRNRARLMKTPITDQGNMLNAVAALPGYDAERAAIFRLYLNYRGPMQAEALRYVRGELVALVTGDEQMQLVSSFLADAREGDDVSTLSQSVDKNPAKRDQVVERILAKAFQMSKAEQSKIRLPMGFIHPSTPLENWIADALDKNSQDMAGVVAESMQAQGMVRAPRLINAFIAYLGRHRKLDLSNDYQTSSKYQAITSMLGKSTLTPDQLERLYGVYRTANPNNNQEYVRAALFLSGKGKIELDPTVLNGRKLVNTCTKQDNGYSCSGGAIN